MSGLEKIKERILEDARQEAESIIENANKRADEILSNAREKADAAREAIASEYEAKRQELKRRMLSMAQLDINKKLLEVKQHMIDAAFDECVRHIQKMPVQDYRALIVKLLLSAVQTGEEEVIFSAADDGRLDNSVINDANNKLKKMGRKGSLKLSKEKGSFNGGFILRYQGMETNSTFDSILRTIREQMEPQVAEILF